MPLDAVALGAIARELNTELYEARIEKIHQPERDELMLVLKAEGKTKRLVISAGSENARMHLAEEGKENPAAPPMFCMLLRKHLTGARIDKIARMGYERAVDICLSGRNEMGDATVRHLICEIMGRNSNIIFADENYKIIDSVKHIDLSVSTVRNILPGLSYKLPPSGGRINPENAGYGDYEAVFFSASEGEDADKAVTSRVMGISPLLAGECIYRACGERRLKIGEMSPAQKQASARELAALFEKEKAGEFSPCILKTENTSLASDFSAFEIKQYEGLMLCEKKESMNEAARDFYFLRDRQKRMQERSGTITKIISNNLHRCEKKLNILQSELKSAADRDKYKIYGDLLSANLYRIKKGDKSAVVQNFYSGDMEDVEIPLDINKTPSQNAQRYYTRYKKAKNTELYASEQLDITADEMSYLESVLYSVENAQTPSELAEIKAELAAAGYIRSERGKKKKEKEVKIQKPMEFEYKGYTIYIGRNNVQNDYLTMKTARSRDLWLHTKNIAGSHTIVKFNGEPFPPDVIETAASLAAFFSKGKNAPYVEVDYCPVSHVKKPSGAKAGMVIYEGYNTAFVAPGKSLAEKLRK